MKKFAYLSGAPRVTTKAHAENAAARAHILGIADALEKHGYVSEFYILGDRLPANFSAKGSEKQLTSGLLSKLLSDALRIFFRFLNRKNAIKCLSKDLDFVYERFGLFQAVGEGLKEKHGTFWILETNAILSQEASEESKTSILQNLAKKYERKAYDSCDLIVCITKELKESIVSTFNIDPDKIFVMRNAINPDLFSTSDKLNSNSNNNRLNIMYLGSLTPWCRLELLFESLSSYSKKHLVSIEVFGDGGERERLELIAKEKQLDILFNGKLQLSEIISRSNEFDIAYCNSVHGDLGAKTYGSPMKLYEYMAMGLPILGGKIEDNLAVLQEGVTGFLFEWNNIGEIKKSLSLALENKKKLPNMGREARKKVFENHTWEKRISRLLLEINKRK